ncbi:uncharacterized protein Bfra_011873 [Botrytis fragariae]|uniref:Uncharacterized protein n=1 Tax=Botrytis fragariae TaxID=1964551 RepID=A0A8H6EE95_9HELO|nr:uncharacterized protein Bfra_011873 [Botrytis fragariae]KAF5868908.1 hypothetical protein Bfra_011873 [Botrytis fragariae]
MRTGKRKKEGYRPGTSIATHPIAFSLPSDELEEGVPQFRASWNAHIRDATMDVSYPHQEIRSKVDLSTCFATV